MLVTSSQDSGYRACLLLDYKDVLRYLPDYAVEQLVEAWRCKSLERAFDF
jgi:hypothetical protein